MPPRARLESDGVGTRAGGEERQTTEQTRCMAYIYADYLPHRGPAATTFQSHDALEQNKIAIQSVTIRMHAVCDRKRFCHLHNTMRQQFAPLFGVGGDRLFWPGFTRENNGDVQLSPNNQPRKHPHFTTTRLMNDTYS